MSVRTRTHNRPSGAAHGVLVVDKPGAMTSHDVVSRVRRAFGTRRVGHAGTLDPMATGVLVILLGEATKLSSVLTTDRKTYEARVKFGTATDSLDADGVVTKRVELKAGWLDPVRLESALSEERARRLQIPPQVSAIQVNGERAYARARKGETTQLPPRDVTIHSLTLLEVGEDYVDLHLAVSKGFYVRSLAHDLGHSLGVPAHLSRLRRTQSGPFDLSSARDFPLSGDEELLGVAEAARLCLPILQVTPEGALRIGQGKRLRETDLVADGPPNNAELLAAFHEANLLGLVEPADGGEYRVKRGINDPNLVSSTLPLAENKG